jgi:hypothetical protein
MQEFAISVPQLDALAAPLPHSTSAKFAKAECSLIAQPIFAALVLLPASPAKPHPSAQLALMATTCKLSTTWPLENAWPAAATVQLAPIHHLTASPAQLAQTWSHSSASPLKTWAST